MVDIGKQQTLPLLIKRRLRAHNGDYCAITIQLFAHVIYHIHTALLITILNSECSYAEFPSLKTEQELRGCAETMQDVVSGLNATLDGANIPNLEKYRIQTNPFNFTYKTIFWT